eukprot:546056_1
MASHKESTTTNHVNWKADIKDKFILLVEAYSKRIMTSLPPEMTDIILLYYAKPLLMKLEIRYYYENMELHILYCPVEGTYNSMINDMKTVLNSIEVPTIEYKNIEINNDNWNDLKWDPNEPFYISRSGAALKDWVAVWDSNSRRKYYANMTTKETSWSPPAVWSGQEWIAVLDSNSGRKYYANMTTKETSWSPPAVWSGQEWIAVLDSNSGRMYYA